MQNNQLTDFDDAPNVVDDDYELEVEMTFCRREGDTLTTSAISMGSNADYLPAVLAAVGQFLNQLGFTYVAGLTAFNEDGEAI